MAPIKPKSIPRLELMAGRILAALMDTVQKAINLEIHSTHLWLDSYTALCWIANHQEWKQFVKARVNEILSLTTENQWRHCPSEDNPADIGSRGMNATELEKSELWWNRPEWITKSPDQWPADIVKQTTEESVAERLVTLSTTKNIEDEYKLQIVLDPGRYSSEKKLLRVTAWIIRFAWNCLTKNKVKGSLNSEEIRNTKNCWIREAQTELKRQPNYEQLKLRLGVREVNGILKCFGRWGQSELELETKQPVLLPRNHPLTRLIINSSHVRTLHGGVNITLAEIRRNYWIPKGRQQVKRSTMHCVTCKKVQGKSFLKAHIGELPSIRSTPARPFERTGVDFAGPLYVKQDGKSNKTYVAIFSCAVMRRMDLALVKDQSTNTFKNELKKFIARRGAPSLMISDNAKTFKATENGSRKCQK